MPCTNWKYFKLGTYTQIISENSPSDQFNSTCKKLKTKSQESKPRKIEKMIGMCFQKLYTFFYKKKKIVNTIYMGALINPFYI